jgi:exopolysaccharide production protein ExoQ
MPPTLALTLWLILLVALFVFDPAKDRKASPALWVTVIWMFFLGSRPPALWLGVYGASHASEALEQGNPLDRTVFLLLTLAAFAILVSRSVPWRRFVTQNSALAGLLAFALLSVAWSDFPFATFKKWFRDIGIYMAILIVVSDARPLEATRTVLRRLCYLLIPLSVVLIKFYPQLGMGFSDWGGYQFTGVSTSKNMLGAVCLISGIFFFWDTVTSWPQRRSPRVRRTIFVNLAFVGMTLWLLNLSDSKTSTICLVLGCLVMAAAQSNFGRRHPTFVKVMSPAAFLLYVILTLGFGLGSELSVAVGRSSNMSHRTHIWEVLMSAPINPLFGTGYQTFWVGPRLHWAWERLDGDNVTSAHNGYLQIYLDLGIIGLFLFCAFLVATYRKVCKDLTPLTPVGLLGVGLWAVLIFYNVTEAFAEINLLLASFLFAGIRIPHRALNDPLTGERSQIVQGTATNARRWTATRAAVRVSAKSHDA